MTLAISKAAEAGARAVICASTGNTSASAAAYAVRGGMVCGVLVPEGKIALGKMSQALAHGARLLQVQGSFDDCLTLARDLSEKYPVALVNSVNPVRIEGQKTAAFEIVDALGDAPDVHVLPVGNAGNITAYWKGYREYAGRRHRQSRTPRMWGFQAAGAAPIVSGEPVLRPSTIATAIRIGNPASWAQAVAARDESGGLIHAVTDRQILRAYRWLAAREGVFVEPASAASVAGLLQAHEQGLLEPGQTVVCTVTGHGLKDPQWAIDGAPAPRTVPVDAYAAAVLLGPRGLMAGAMFRAAPLRVRVPATAANLGPAFDACGPRPEPVRRHRRPGHRVGPGRAGRRGGRRHRCRPASGTWSSRRCARRSRCSAASRAGSRCGAPTGSRTGAVWARARPRSWPAWSPHGRSSSAGPTGWTTWPCCGWPPSSRGTRTTWPPACSAGSRSPGPAPDGVRAVSSAGRGRGRPGGARADDLGVDGEGAADAARGGAVRGRRVRRRAGGAAQRGDDQPTRPAPGCHRGPAAPAVPGLGDAAVGRPGRAAARPRACRRWCPGPARPSWRWLTAAGADRVAAAAPRDWATHVLAVDSGGATIVPMEQSDAAVLRPAGGGAAGHDRATHLVGGRYRSAEVLLWATHQAPDGPVLQRTPSGRPYPAADPRVVQRCESPPPLDLGARSNPASLRNAS